MKDKFKNKLRDVGFKDQSSSNWMSYTGKCVFCGGTDSVNQNHLHLLVESENPIIAKCFRPKKNRLKFQL